MTHRTNITAKKCSNCHDTALIASLRKFYLMTPVRQSKATLETAVFERRFYSNTHAHHLLITEPKTDAIHCDSMQNTEHI